MPRYAARIEFRRRTPSSAWVIAGVTVASRFWPSRAGVETVRGRLPSPGLVGWAEIDTPIVAPHADAAAATALDLARTRWPDRVSPSVPWSAGVAELRPGRRRGT